MADITVYPNNDGSVGGWTTESSGTTNLYASIDEGTDSPNDVDYITTSTLLDSIFLPLADMPAMFGTATAITIKLRCQRTAVKGDYLDIDHIQLVQSDELTAITSTASVADSTAITTLSISPGIIGGTSKSIWDNAKLKIKSGSGTDGSVLVYATQIDITYTPSNTTYDELGAGGVTSGSATTLKATYNQICSGGASGGGRAFRTENIIASPTGVKINGSFSPVYYENGIGGSTVGSSIQISEIINISGTGGSTNGGMGSAYNIFILSSSSGSTCSGTALISVDFITTGGTTGGGDTVEFRTLYEFVKFGQNTRVSGTSLISINCSILAGSEGVLGLGSATQGTSIVIFGGSLAGGISKPNIGFMGTGGVIATGGLAFLSFTSTGGIKNGGSAIIKTTSNIQVYNPAPGGLSINFNRFVLYGNKVVPSVSTTSSANAIITLSGSNIIGWEIYHDLTSTISSIGFYGPAAVGATGPLIINLATYSSISPYSIGQASVLPSQIADLINENWYLQINTTNNPSGELRSQVFLSGTRAIVSVEATNINASGEIVIGGSSDDNMIGMINGGSKAGGLSYIQSIHSAIVDTSTGVFVYGSVINEMGGLFVFDEIGMRGAKIGGGALTSVYPINGALLSGSANVFALYTDVDKITLTGSQVVPPQLETNNASALISLSYNNVITWNIDYDGPESSITNIRFRGPAIAGVIGPTALELGPISGLNMPNAGSYVLTASLANAFKENEFYIEIYDNSNPVLRSQILLNGTGLSTQGTSLNPYDFTSIGGSTKMGGSTIILLTINPPHNGGATLGGTATINKVSRLVGKLGAKIGGLPLISFNYNLVPTGGSIVGGKSIAGITFVPQGGSTIAGEAILLIVHNYTANSGMIANGSIKIQNFYLSQLSFGGIKIGGKSKVVKIFEVNKINQSVYRAIENNLLNTSELILITQAIKLIQITDGPIPEYEGEFSDSEWCDPEVRCEQGIVPEVIQNRQPLLPGNKITN